MRRDFRRFLFGLLAAFPCAHLITASPAVAADTCHYCFVPISTEMYEQHAGDVKLGVQFDYRYRDENTGEASRTFLNGLPRDDERIATTQFLLTGSVAMTPYLSFDVVAPVISRSFVQHQGDTDVHDRDNGIGDVALLVNLLAYQMEDDPKGIDNDGTYLSFRVGTELPTGSTDELGDPDVPGSAVRGSDLAFGSGSFDPIFGVNLFNRYGILSTYFDAQYTLNTEGDHDFKYGDEIVVRASSLVRIGTSGRAQFSIGPNLTYRHLEENERDSSKIEDSGSDQLYVGPEALLDIGKRVAFQAAVDIPVSQSGNGRQLLDSYLVHVGVTGRL